MWKLSSLVAQTDRTDVSQRGMQSLSIVKGFQVLNDRLASLRGTRVNKERAASTLIARGHHYSIRLVPEELRYELIRYTVK